MWWQAAHDQQVSSYIRYPCVAGEGGRAPDVYAGNDRCCAAGGEVNHFEESEWSHLRPGGLNHLLDLKGPVLWHLLPETLRGTVGSWQLGNGQEEVYEP